MTPLARTILAIDPGPIESAWMIWDGERVLASGKQANEQILWALRGGHFETRPDDLVVERFQSYGMPVGNECLESVRWEGRFLAAWGGAAESISRMQVKQHLCHDSRARDSNIRQALIDRFGPPGMKKNPGLLYGVKGDLWAALALAVTWWDRNVGGP